MEVKFVQPSEVNLLGYFLRDMLTSSLATEKGRDLARSLTGAVRIVANEMTTTIVFREFEIELDRGNKNQVAARISGDLSVLFEVISGAHYFSHVIRGNIKVSGNLIKILKLLKLFRLSS